MKRANVVGIGPREYETMITEKKRTHERSQCGWDWLRRMWDHDHRKGTDA
ncbi:hypothetical protein AALB64_02840 [Lachnospiraceae bacterium 45-P1]